MQQKALNDKNLKKRELPIAADFENMLAYQLFKIHFLLFVTFDIMHWDR